MKPWERLQPRIRSRAEPDLVGLSGQAAHGLRTRQGIPTLHKRSVLSTLFALKRSLKDDIHGFPLVPHHPPDDPPDR